MRPQRILWWEVAPDHCGLRPGHLEKSLPGVVVGFHGALSFSFEMIITLKWWMKHHFWTWLQGVIASSLVFADCWGSSYGTDGGAPRVFDVSCWVSGFALNFCILIQSLFRWDEFMNWMGWTWSYCTGVKGAYIQGDIRVQKAGWSSTV